MIARGPFDTADWDAKPPFDDRDGVSLGHVSMSKTFHGDLTATSVVHLVVVSTPVAESRSYVAVERVEGVLQGRKGTFVVQHNAVSDRGRQSLRVSVVPDSGTGELTGLRGEMTIDVGSDGAHSYVFDYTLES
ncbi:DUF3224 domain-containing protein [Nonomuraea sp. SBT364]|uniref:DUF3224 domain-containing protein n=1 Tax=Nonomuraea sp. SBT364 TaxID=1580530 RepID=UPI00066D32D9|nr:DUF3224 domain-containing protein [Nonomuraea sp. SBT364]